MLHQMTAVLVALMDSLAETVFAGQPLTWTLKMLHLFGKNQRSPYTGTGVITNCIIYCAI